MSERRPRDRRALEERQFELEEMKFHWDKWKAESQAFWGRAVLGAGLLLLSVAFQFQIITLNTSNDYGLAIRIPKSSWQFYLAVNALSWFLLVFLCFKFTDLLRHRVPEWMEQKVHTNLLPNPLHRHFRIGRSDLNLIRLTHLFYLIFPAYAVVMGFILAIALYQTAIAKLL